MPENETCSACGADVVGLQKYWGDTSHLTPAQKGERLWVHSRSGHYDHEAQIPSSNEGGASNPAIGSTVEVAGQSYTITGVEGPYSLAPSGAVVFDLHATPTSGPDAGVPFVLPSWQPDAEAYFEKNGADLLAKLSTDDDLYGPIDTNESGS